ncbi:MAG TPA: glycosyltransferase, partial [Acidimicrobiales bacterium]|nr:glycosyltransferase [Acidimicrobiales bacterium]
MVPVHNVAATLERDIRALRRSLDESFPFLAVVTIADTGSSDGTAPIAQDLAATLPGVQALLFDRDDLGHVLRMALASSRTEIVVCADGPSSASLPRLVSLAESVLTGPVDLAVA